MKTTYLLIHGAWHASWCWQYVMPLLKNRGHDVIAPDLPGHGKNMMDFREITLATYVAYIEQLVMSLQKPPILVGHSMAGVIISQVAENIPEHIKQLIYISAFIPANQRSLIQEAQQIDTPGLSSELAIDHEKKEMILKKTSKTKNLLFNCCKEQDVKLALSLLASEPLQPFNDTIKISNERFGKVEKLYISCLQDQPLPIKDQKRMYEKINCKTVSINTDHSPFFSAADRLVDIILNN